MPELPEVEVLVRHMDPLVRGQEIQAVTVRREKSIRPGSRAAFVRNLRGAMLHGVRRRAKYLVFDWQPRNKDFRRRMLGHLGMTGRMYLLPGGSALPRHAAVVIQFQATQFVFEDPRYFGRLSLDLSPLEKLGPEPLSADFGVEDFARVCRRSMRPIKNLLLDQTVVAGLGNIYAGEALFRSGLSPRLPAARIGGRRLRRLHAAIVAVLEEAIELGSTMVLDWSGKDSGNRLFYYGEPRGAESAVAERFHVYGRAGQPCRVCGTPIHRIVQSGRSSFYCRTCQRA